VSLDNPVCVSAHKVAIKTVTVRILKEFSGNRKGLTGNLSVPMGSLNPRLRKLSALIRSLNPRCRSLKVLLRSLTPRWRKLRVLTGRPMGTFVLSDPTLEEVVSATAEFDPTLEKAEGASAKTDGYVCTI
jgi:hypothetical protein